MTRPERLTISGPKDALVSALLYRVPAELEPLGLLVLAHGAGAGQSSTFIRDAAAGLAARGLSVLTFY